MQHTKFRGTRPTGFGAEDFLGFLTYKGMAATLVMWPASYQQILISLYLKINILNLVKNGPVVSGKGIF